MYITEDQYRLKSIDSPKYIYNVSTGKPRENVNIKGLYLYNINDFDNGLNIIIGKTKAKEDDLLVFYSYFSDDIDDGIELYFKSEKDCLLFRLKYGI